MKTTASNLIRWAGVSAMAGGSLFIFMQAIHPPEILASVSTSAWTTVHYLGVGMCLLTMLGIAGIYTRQVERAGWMGLAGFLALEVMWVLTAAFQFVEGFILPLLVTEAPAFVEGFVRIPSGSFGDANLGLLPTVYSVTGVLYLLGGVLLGIATFRARILPRLAGAALAVGTVAPVTFSLLPHEFLRLAAVPFGLSLAWLGYALWSERRAPAAQTAPTLAGAQLHPAAAE